MKFFLINDSILLSIIVWAVVLVLLMVIFKKRARIASFTREVNTELQKATWPWDPKEKAFGAKYKELIDSTVVVIIAMILLSAFVAIADFALLGLNKFLFPKP